MKQKEALPQKSTAESDSLLCFKYYGEVLGIAAMAEHHKHVTLPIDCDPDRFAQICGHATFSPNEYLLYLESLGFKSEEIKAGVERIEADVLGTRARARKLFEIFKTEWQIEQSVLEKYLDSISLYHFLELVVADAASTKARLKAIKRHAENHAMKADVFLWLDSQPQFKSIESAAMAITKQQPIAHTTARDWYKEWKNLHPAGRP